MQPATIRRLLVFGVCLAGVGGLYLVPGMVRSPDQTSAPARHGRSTPAPSPPNGVPATAPARPGSALITSGTLPPTAPTATGVPVRPVAAVRREPATPRTAGAPATAAAPGRDDTPPAAVGLPQVAAATVERLTVAWPSGADDIGVVSYQVWLNGFLVVATQRTSATVRWFNDTNIHVVQVRARDAAGNEGPPSPTLIVHRPHPSPTPGDGSAGPGAGTEEDGSG
jgi:hypothetical protein